jgi:NADH-quinone oxidoreductase subunit M
MSMASLGLPLLISFAGETLALYGAFISQSFRAIPLGFVTLPINIQWMTGLSTFGIVLGAAYSLWLVKRLFFGAVSPACETLEDAKANEVWVLGTLAFLVLVLGFKPQLLTNQFESNTQAIGKRFEQVLVQRDQAILQQLKGEPSQNGGS